MAARLVQQPRRIVAYLPNLRTAVKHFRAFSSYDERRPPSNNYIIVDSSSSEDSTTVWPDKLGVLGPKDSRFSLPGLLGPSHLLKVETDERLPSIPKPLPDILTTPLPHERQAAAFSQIFSEQFVSETSEEIEDQLLTEMSPRNMLECQAIECPELVKKDFKSLFPRRDVMSGPLTVITISQRTDNDMMTWSQEVEEERETLTLLFVTGSQEICKALERAGYWADFIDPSSGTPYNDGHINTTMCETDERYMHLGFDIEDLGCCKVLSHPMWGTKTFVGCLFTNAPVDHPVIADMMAKTDWDDHDNDQ